MRKSKRTLRRGFGSAEETQQQYTGAFSPCTACNHGLSSMHFCKTILANHRLGASQRDLWNLEAKLSTEEAPGASTAAQQWYRANSVSALFHSLSCYPDFRDAHHESKSEATPFFHLGLWV